ncbi:MAG TPA: RNA polymerase sigma factor, partial [Planctomycetota bacterium]|nr:RNA polymerase sigma factor [Planctomycetota bacterium]
GFAPGESRGGGPGETPGDASSDGWSDGWLGPATSRRLAAFARRFVHDPGEAEDVAQEALLRATHNLASLRSPGKAEAWLFRICRHAAIDHSRARAVRRAVWAPMPDEAGPQPTAVAEAGRASRPAAGFDLRALAPHQRLLVSLHYERGLSQSTLCRMTGLMPSALRVRLCRARGALSASAFG